MALTVQDNRTIRNEADATTGWTASNGVAVLTGNPDPVESTGCLGTVVSNATEDAYHTGGGVDMSGAGMLVYVWVLPLGRMGTTANGGTQLLIGDGTNRIGFHLAGSDTSVFTYSSGPVGWQCMLIDTSALPSQTTAISGSLGALNLSSITDIGAVFTTLFKSVGGVENCFIDIIRYGNGGLSIINGTTGDRGTFLELAAADSATGNQQAYGVFRELTSNVYGLQGGLSFGTSTATSWFDDSNSTLVFENRPVADDKFFFNVVGGTGETHFFFSGGTISAAGPAVTVDCSSNNIDELDFDSVNFTNLQNAISFGTDTAAQSHTISDCSFNGCGLIDVGVASFTNNTISNSTASSALIISSTNGSNLSDLTFNSGTSTGHAIEITSAGEYNFTRFFFNNYGNDDAADAAFYNNSGGEVTINVVGDGDTPTVRNSAGSSTIINNPTEVTLTGMIDNTEVRVFDGTTGDEIAGIEDVVDGSTNNRSFSFTAEVGETVNIRIFNTEYRPADIVNFTIPNNDTSLPIQQVIDRVYDNPS